MNGLLNFTGLLLFCGCISLSASHRHSHVGMSHIMGNTKDYADHPCRRKCHADEEPMVCDYDFEVTWYSTMSRACKNCSVDEPSVCFQKGCIAGSGTQRAIAVANRQLPGPSIEVCLGDQIRVNIMNMLDDGETTTIHWHGIHQTKTPFMDGVPMGSQCPIMPGASFRYDFEAEQTGTYFWHSHTGFQRLDGLAGPLIIRHPKDPHKSLYDRDNLRPVVIQDWFPNELGVNHFIIQNFGATTFFAPQLLINGVMGSRGDDDKSTGKLPPAEYRLDPRYRYRFRVINNAALPTPIKININGHHMIVIASDGASIEPVVTKSLTLMPAETYDFVPFFTGSDADGEGVYWLTAENVGEIEEPVNPDAATVPFVGLAVAKISYKGGVNPQPKSAHKATGGQSKDVYDEINYRVWERYLEKGNQNKGRKVSQLRALNHDKRIEGKPDYQIVLDFEMDEVKIPQPDDEKGMKLEPEIRFFPRFDKISGAMAPVPLLTQYNEVPEELFCNDKHRHCSEDEYCPCIHAHHVKLGSLVELVFIDRGEDSNDHVLDHPMHLHGFHFRVVGEGAIHGNLTTKEFLQYDKKGQIKRNLKFAPLKTVVGVPTGGYVVVRFVADNPGPWMIHCHIDFHMELGMMLFLRVGKPTDPIPPPRGFPRCHAAWPSMGSMDGMCGMEGMHNCDNCDDCDCCE